MEKEMNDEKPMNRWVGTLGKTSMGSNLLTFWQSSFFVRCSPGHFANLRSNPGHAEHIFGLTVAAVEAALPEHRLVEQLVAAAAFLLERPVHQHTAAVAAVGGAGTSFLEHDFAAEVHIAYAASG